MKLTLDSSVRDIDARVSIRRVGLKEKGPPAHVVLAETVWVLESVYGLKAPQVAISVAMLMEHERLALQDPDVVESAEWKKARESEWTSRLQPRFRDHLRLVLRRYVRGG